MANTLGSHNPLRYRGYYYDRESGFYYLKSRYYDPSTGKFLNADSVSMLISGEKAYTYCENNPVNFTDFEGNSVRYANSRGFVRLAKNELINLNCWIDTILLAGLSPDQSTLSQLAYLYHTQNGSKLGEKYKFIYTKFVDLIIEDISKNPIKESSVDPSTTSAQNYFSNLITMHNEPITGFIYGQNKLSKWRYGLVAIDGHGCGMVALYNAFILLGKKVALADLILFSEIKGFQNRNGEGGTNTWLAIQFFSRRLDVEVKKTNNAEEFYEWSRVSNRVFIESHKTKTGSHAVCAYVEDNLKIKIFNFSAKDTKNRIVDEWTEEIPSDRFNIGVYLKNE